MIRRQILMTMLLACACFLQLHAQGMDENAYNEQWRKLMDRVNKVYETAHPKQNNSIQLNRQFGNPFAGRTFEKDNNFVGAALRHRQFLEYLKAQPIQNCLDSFVALYNPAFHPIYPDKYDYYDLFACYVAELVVANGRDRSQRPVRKEDFDKCLRIMNRNAEGLGLPTRLELLHQPVFTIINNKEVDALWRIHQYAVRDTDFVRKDEEMLDHYSILDSHKMRICHQELQELATEKRQRLGENHPGYALTLTMMAMTYSYFNKLDTARMLVRQAVDIYRLTDCKLAQRLAAQQLSHLYYKEKISLLKSGDWHTLDNYLLQPFQNFNQCISLTREELSVIRPVLGRNTFEVRMAEAELKMLQDACDTILCRRHEDFNADKWKHAVAVYRQGDYSTANDLFREIKQNERYDYLKVRGTYVGQWLAALAQKTGEYGNKTAETARSYDPYYTLQPVDRSLTLHLDSIWSFVDDPDRRIFLREARQLLGDSTQQYARMLIRAYEDLYEHKHYTDAVLPLAQARNICRRCLKGDDPVYVRLLVSLGNLYKAVNYHHEAIAMFEEAQPVVAAISKDSTQIANLLTNLLVCSIKAHDGERTARWAIPASDAYSDVELDTRIQALRVAAAELVNHHIADSLLQVQAIRLAQRAIPLQQRYMDSKFAENEKRGWPKANSTDYIKELKALASIYRVQSQAHINLQQTTASDSLNQLVCNIFSDLVTNHFERRVNEHKSVNHICYREVLGQWQHALLFMAVNQLRGKLYEEALASAQEALHVSKEARFGAGFYDGGSKALFSDDDAFMCQIMAISLNKLGRGSEADSCLRSAMALAHETFGQKAEYYRLLRSLAGQLGKQGRKAEAMQCLKDYWQYLSHDRLQQLVLLNARQREDFWAKEKDFFEKAYPVAVFRFQQPESYGQLYDNALLTKGLLLNTEMEIGRLIDERGTEQQKNIYRQLRQSQLNLMRMQQGSNRMQASIDSLQASIRTQEYELLSVLQQSNDEILAGNLRTSWMEVREGLSDGDVSVEFITIPLNADSLLYAALTLRRDYEQPKLTTLFTERQLQELIPSGYYTTSELYNLLWQPLQTEIQGAGRIFFSPAGALHQIGIEYLPGMEGRNIYRLSSTRELVREAHSNPVESEGNRDVAVCDAVLYGGINYHLSDDERETIELQAVRGNERSEYRDVPDVSTLRELRGSAGYLPVLEGSLHEVNDISGIMDKQHFTHMLITGSEGTESSVKALSGQRKNILHISTHGFYQSADDNKSSSDDGAEMVVLGTTNEDRSMSRSGLLFAGAGDYLYDDMLAQGDDGILTAREISRLDLRGLGLVVLSACETGLGDVSGEGVFGLQRGFKKAGAQTLLMSLWKVDDLATQLLMTEFYRLLTIGNGKRDAFLGAQQHLRTIEGGKYNHPEYWAAFIMLDALE